MNNHKGAIKPKLNSREYKALQSNQVSPYYPNDISTIKMEPNFSQDIEKGNFYTLVVGDDVRVIKDMKSEDRTKAVIAFYNLSDKENLLLRANSQINIFENVKAKSNASRKINAAKVKFSIMREGQALTELDDFIIERGNHYGVFYSGGEANIIKARIDFDQ